MQPLHSAQELLRVHRRFPQLEDRINLLQKQYFVTASSGTLTNCSRIAPVSSYREVGGLRQAVHMQVWPIGIDVSGHSHQGRFWTPSLVGDRTLIGELAV